MKIKLFTFILIFIIFLPAYLFSAQQEKNIPQTKIESLLLKKGNLIFKKYFEIGEMTGFEGIVKLQSLIISESDLDKNNIKGISLEISNTKTGDNNNSFLDLDEVESLVKAIDHMVNLLKEWKYSKNYSEVFYISKDDFKVGFYQKGNLISAFISNGHIINTQMSFDINNLQVLKEMIEKGQKILNEN